jgi:hypothetical protein
MALLPTAITIINIIMLFRSSFQGFTTYSHYYHYHHHAVSFFFPWLYYLQPLQSLPSSCCFVLLSKSLLLTAITIITIIMSFRSSFHGFTTYSHYTHVFIILISLAFTFFDDDNFWFAAILPLPEELLPGVPQPLPLPYEPVHGGEALRPLLRVQPGVVSCTIKNE